ncbi:MAG: thioredoxin family protein [Desulfobacteraceae bacterium]|nr:thioredoxin family protein [Desulfobacteraceae bacterium]
MVLLRRHRSPVARAAWVISMIVLTLVSLWTVSQGLADTNSVQWFKYEEGMARQESTGKKALITFTAEWCSYCAKMERETFSDRRVAAFLNEAFVPIRVDYDRENRVVEEFNVRKIPATWFVDEKGERISNLPGFVPAEMFLNILRYVESDRYKTVPFSEYIRSL